MPRIPTITKYLLGINIGVFIIDMLFGQVLHMDNLLGLHFVLAPNFHVFQLVTYMFMHGGWTHLFFNMFALWMFGCVIEQTLGAKRFLFYYLVCGIGAGITQELAQTGEYLLAGYLNLGPTVGASGAIYGILLAFGMLYPTQKIFIFPIPVPIKAKWFVIIYAAIELFSAIGSSNDGVAHAAHLGGMLFGLILLRIWKHRRHIPRRHRQSSVKTQKRQKFHYQSATPNTSHEPDTQSVAKDSQAVDAILDKIRTSGYDSLTLEEKQALFDRK